MRKALLATVLVLASAGAARAKPALWGFGFDDRDDDADRPQISERVYRRDCAPYLGPIAPQPKPDEAPRYRFRLTLGGLPTGLDFDDRP